jgi:hypothetical protein
VLNYDAFTTWECFRIKNNLEFKQISYCAVYEIYYFGVCLTWSVQKTLLARGSKWLMQMTKNVVDSKVLMNLWKWSC